MSESKFTKGPMTPEERIDDAVNRILKASNASQLRFYMPLTQDRLREAMRQIMSESYIAGSDAMAKIVQEGRS